PPAASAVALSPDGRTLAVGGSAADSVRLWDVVTGKERRELAGGRPSLPSENSPDTSLVFAAGGKVLAAAHGKTIRLWNVEDGSLVRELPGHSERIFALAL